MKATNTPFNTSDPSESVDRMKAILNASDGAFEEKNSIPVAESLTFENGFYVNCSALFIDIRGSSRLPELHTRPVLAKIYRTYISECVAVMNSDPNCREIFINGDCVSAILDTPYQRDINTAFDSAAKLNSLVMILNWQLEKKGYTSIECGIGLAYGRALMHKAGLKGYAINEIVWMGDVVNEASNLCGQGNKDSNAPVQVSTVVHGNLTETYKGFLRWRLNLDPVGGCFEGDVINVAMDKWLTEQKEKERRDALTSAHLNSLFRQIPVPPRLGLGGLLASAPVRPPNALMSLAELAEFGYLPKR